MWYSLKYFSLQLISLKPVSKAITTNVNICWVIWLASAHGWAARGGPKAPHVTRLDSGGSEVPHCGSPENTSCETWERYPGEGTARSRGLRSRWVRTELRTSGSASRMRSSPWDVSPTSSPHREQDQTLQLGVRSAPAVWMTHPGEGAGGLNTVLPVRERFISVSFLFPPKPPGSWEIKMHQNTTHKGLFLISE